MTGFLIGLAIGEPPDESAEVTPDVGVPGGDGGFIGGQFSRGKWRNIKEELARQLQLDRARDLREAEKARALASLEALKAETEKQTAKAERRAKIMRRSNERAAEIAALQHANSKAHAGIAERLINQTRHAAYMEKLARQAQEARPVEPELSLLDQIIKKYPFSG